MPMTNQTADLIGQALSFLRAKAANPPPLQLGNHLLTAVTDSVAFQSHTQISAKPPSPTAKPVGIIWRDDK